MRIATGFADAAMFADALYIPAKRYRGYEAGTKVPALDDLVAIADLTGQTLDFLIVGRSLGD